MHYFDQAIAYLSTHWWLAAAAMGVDWGADRRAPDGGRGLEIPQNLASHCGTKERKAVPCCLCSLSLLKRDRECILIISAALRLPLCHPALTTHKLFESIETRQRRRPCRIRLR